MPWDATCNGYQHLSLLTGNEPLAGQLNLISGDNDTKPKDVDILKTQ